MNWIQMFLPLAGVIVGWLLAEWGKLSLDKRLNKRKLKKLLFFLLELRYHFFNELSIESDIAQYWKVVKVRLGSQEVEDFWKPLIEQLKEKLRPESKLEYLEKNVDDMILELAEVFPMLAYELNGRHNVKEKLGKFDHYIRQISAIAEPATINLKEIIDPLVTERLLHEIDESLRIISRQINWRMHWNVKRKISLMTDTTQDEMDINQLVDELLRNMAKATNDKVK